MPERLRRLEHVFQQHPIYFVTICTFGRRQILATRDLHTALVAFAEAGPTHGAWVGAYVIMPDHLHVFVALDDERIKLSTWSKSLKNALSKNLRHTSESPHWQKGFFDHVLRNEESYAQKWNYVRDNPVRARLVKRWDEWSFLGQVFGLEFSDQQF
ncbi:MAG TPA: transposase [Candidatus Udaeobacter sp.]|nr:transposase [Candidatus Udaeobacter sp.]